MRIPRWLYWVGAGYVFVCLLVFIPYYLAEREAPGEVFVANGSSHLAHISISSGSRSQEIAALPGEKAFPIAMAMLRSGVDLDVRVEDGRRVHDRCVVKERRATGLFLGVGETSDGGLTLVCSEQGPQSD